jgi:sigma-B regulation protein RsbU (phosphoserine phosphatase)
MDETYAIRDLLANFLNHSEDNIYFKDRQSRFVLVNDAFARYFGAATPAEFIGKSDFDLFSDEHARPAFEDEKRIMETGEPMLGMEEKEVWPDGHVTWVSTSKMPLLNTEGEIIGTFGVSRDITARKEAEQKLVKYAQELQQLNAGIEADIEMADRFQKAFLPNAYPHFAPAGQSDAVEFAHRYEAGGQIGGDFCAIRKLSENKTAILVCDVMGHGVRSALVTGIVRALSEELLQVEFDPGALLSRMNHQIFPILRQSEDFVFLTAACIVLDVCTGALEYASAGHPAPLHMKADSAAEALPLPGRKDEPAIPLFPGTTYQTHKVQLSPRDIVVVYTDGLVETVNAEGEEYGEDRLLASLSANGKGSMPSIFEKLMRDACAFSGSKRFEDDVCLAGLRFIRPLRENEMA